MLKCAEKLNCQGRLCCCTGPFPLLQAPAYLGTLVGGDPPAPMPTHCCPEEATRLHHCEESHDAACLGCAEGIHFANEEFHSRKGMYHHYIVAGGRWLLFLKKKCLEEDEPSHIAALKVSFLKCSYKHSTVNTRCIQSVWCITTAVIWSVPKINQLWKEHQRSELSKNDLPADYGQIWISKWLGTYYAKLVLFQQAAPALGKLINSSFPNSLKCRVFYSSYQIFPISFLGKMYPYFSRLFVCLQWPF